MNKILQIENDAFVQIEIKKSKFLCFSFAVQSKQQVEDIIAKLKTQHKDATHVCYSYVLNGQEKAFDDGEPQGTAGKPILDCIKRKKLNNTLVVIVRYFGGIKLGAGGLIRAYSNGAKTVLDNSGTKEKTICNKISFKAHLNEQKNLQNLLKNNLVLKSEIEYQQDININIYFLPETLTNLTKLLNDCFAKEIQFVVDEKVYYI
ncbi:MAG: IMPACT family protein [Christensenellales bacterium]